MDINKIRKVGKKIKLQIFKKFIQIKEGHPGSILSIFDVVNCLYLGKFIKSSKDLKKNDIFIMSKGHSGSVQYPYLVRNSIINKKEWIKWKKNSKSIFKIFPNHNIYDWVSENKYTSSKKVELSTWSNSYSDTFIDLP